MIKKVVLLDGLAGAGAGQIFGIHDQHGIAGEEHDPTTHMLTCGHR